FICFCLIIRQTPRSTLFPTRRSSDLEQETVERAKRDAEEGKAPSTQAGEFVREEMDHIREGKHGAASPQQAIAIGLSKARRAGVDRKSTRLNSSHLGISYAVFCLKKK